MAYTAYYQISRLLGEVARVAWRAAIAARTSYATDALSLRAIRENIRMIKQYRVEIDDFNWSRFGGVESQCVFTGMLASLRITDALATSLRDTDYSWTSRKRVRECWKVINQKIRDHFEDLASNDIYLTGDPYWLAYEVRVWFKAWRNNLQVYFNT